MEINPKFEKYKAEYHVQLWIMATSSTDVPRLLDLIPISLTPSIQQWHQRHTLQNTHGKLICISVECRSSIHNYHLILGIRFLCCSCCWNWNKIVRVAFKVQLSFVTIVFSLAPWLTSFLWFIKQGCIPWYSRTAKNLFTLDKFTRLESTPTLPLFYIVILPCVFWLLLSKCLVSFLVKLCRSCFRFVMV